MAERPVFISDTNEKDYIKIKTVKFEWFSGFSISQKQKSLASFHEQIKIAFPGLSVLEVSSKSDKELGVSLSAFNLLIKAKNGKEFSVETAFQASKVFELGGPFIDLYEKTSKEAKKDTRIRQSGELTHFQFFSRKWDLEPKTLFYDWLYINALSMNKELAEQVVKYNAFTDIEFNPQKSINCQAKSVALYVSLFKMNLLEEALKSVEDFKKVVIKKGEVTDQEKNQKKYEQLDIFSEIKNEM